MRLNDLLKTLPENVNIKIWEKNTLKYIGEKNLQDLFANPEHYNVQKQTIEIFGRDDYFLNIYVKKTKTYQYALILSDVDPELIIARNIESWVKATTLREKLITENNLPGVKNKKYHLNINNVKIARIIKENG